MTGFSIFDGYFILYIYFVGVCGWIVVLLNRNYTYKIRKRNGDIKERSTNTSYMDQVDIHSNNQQYQIVEVESRCKGVIVVSVLHRFKIIVGMSVTTGRFDWYYFVNRRPDYGQPHSVVVVVVVVEDSHSVSSTQCSWVVHHRVGKEEVYLSRSIHHRGPSHLSDFQVYDHGSLYQLLAYVDGCPYTRLAQDMLDTAVRWNPGTAIPLIGRQENCHGIHARGSYWKNSMIGVAA